MTLDIRLIIVQTLISIILPAVVVVLVAKLSILPAISTLIDEKLLGMSNVTKAAASVLGSQGVDVKQLKKMEKMVMGDLLEQYPEIELALDRFSPETADYMRNNPKAALILMQRWGPYLEKFMGGAVKGDEEIPFMY